MPYNNLVYELKEGNVALVTLNRPHRLNALSVELLEELMDILDQIESDEEVHTMVITGAPRPDGRPCFSAGGDIKEMKEIADTEIKALGTEEEIVKALWTVGEQHDMSQSIYDRFLAFPKPTIAAIDGVCTAGGLTLALVCDLRVAATTARISDLHMKNLSTLLAGVDCRPTSRAL